MLKKRIGKWGLDNKRNRKIEMIAVVRKEHQRSRIGKQSTFRARGHQIDYNDVIRYWERKHMGVEDVLAEYASREPTPEGVEVITPVSSPVSTPTDFAVPERLLKIIADYYRASFENGVWISVDPTSLCESTKDPGNAILLLSHLLHHTNSACHLFDVGKPREAGQYLISGTAVVKKLICAEFPMTVPFVLAWLAHFCRKGRPEMAMAIMQQIATLGNVVLSPNHPTPQIFSYLSKVESSKFIELVSRINCSLGDCFEHELGATHPSTISARNSYAYTVQHDNILSTQRQRLLPNRGQMSELHDVQWLVTRDLLAQHLLHMKRYAEAERKCHEILKYISLQDTPTRAVGIPAIPYANVLFMLALIDFICHNVYFVKIYLRN